MRGTPPGGGGQKGSKSDFKGGFTSFRVQKSDFGAAGGSFWGPKTQIPAVFVLKPLFLGEIPALYREK